MKMMMMEKWKRTSMGNGYPIDILSADWFGYKYTHMFMVGPSCVSESEPPPISVLQSKYVSSCRAASLSLNQTTILSSVEMCETIALLALDGGGSHLLYTPSKRCVTGYILIAPSTRVIKEHFISVAQAKTQRESSEVKVKFSTSDRMHCYNHISVPPTPTFIINTLAKR